MQESPDRPPTAAPPADVAFVERWADFTKAYAIYPATNGRVQGALDAMREYLDAALATRANAAGGLEITFVRDGVEVGDAEVAMAEGSNLHWLHARVRKASLSAVTFLPTVPSEALLAFTERLLELFTRADAEDTFEAIWPEIPAGMRLQDQRFVGRFRAEGEGDAPAARATPTAAPHSQSTSGDQALVDLLMEDEGIRDALASFQACLDEATTAGDETHQVDVLGRLIQQMPPDAMDDRETLLRVTRTALQALESRVAGQGDVQALPDDVSLLQLMFEASQGLLGRAGPTNEEVAFRLREHAREDVAEEPGQTGHAGDEKIRDDADLFWQDLARLPPPWTESLTTESLESVPEQVGVFLHFFAAEAEDELMPLARAGLEQRLRRAGPPEAAVLLPYLRPPPDGRDDAFHTRYERMLAFLRDAQLGRLLRECGLLRRDDIIANFPRDFGLYLESLDVAVDADREELAEVAAVIGPRRIEAAAEALVTAEGMTHENRMEPILQTESRAMLPFLRVLLGQVDRGRRWPIVAALRRLRGNDEAACLLAIVDEPELLPLKYLQALATEKDADSWTQRDLIAGVICRYLYATNDRPEKAERRAYAIRFLEHFMTPDARKLLTEIVHARRYMAVHREPRVVRQAARRVLRATKLR